MPDELTFQATGRHSSSRTRTGEKRLLGLFQGRDGLRPGDGREVLQELGQRLPCFEVIEQRRKWYTSANEHGRTAHDLRVAVNDRLGLFDLARPLVAVSVKLSLSQR